MEGTIENPEKLTDIQKIFLKRLGENNSDLYLNNISTLFSLKKDKLKSETEKQIERINELKVDRIKSSSRNKEAWRILERFVENKTPEIKKHNLITIIYGSIIFDDAHNLDFDILFANEHEVPYMSKEGLGWSSELNRSWIGSEGHTSHLSLDRLRTHCKAFDKGWEQYINDYTEEIAYDFGASSIIMTGEAIFPTTQNRKVGIERLDRMKDQVWELALETPEFMASMLFDLQDTTVIRETRRSGLAPHQTREDKAMKSYINEFIIARKK